MKTDDVAVALSAALNRHGQLRGTVQNLKRLTGGATKQTWAFDLVGEGQTQPLILQQTPAAVATANRAPKLSAEQDALLMMAARAGGVPAPVVRVILQPEDGLGGGYVTERVEGETLGRRIVQDDAFAAARANMASQCGAILAAIHRLPTAELPFLATLSPADELAIYGGLLTPYQLQHPALAYALRWVQDHLPGTWKPALVHADFRTGNLIVGPEGVRCVLDWEIARIGDPMQDLGVLCMRTWGFSGALPVGGFGRREDLYAAYEAGGGASVDPERVRFWEAFSNLKWAISCVRRGLATKSDGRAAGVEMCAIGRRLEEPLWDFFALLETTAGGH
ncbi:MAG: phosphotransferase family protein [Sulfuricaulis sp.]|nr:phosphotransferase family protein [Sulfuricaulis sp.]